MVEWRTTVVSPVVVHLRINSLVKGISDDKYGNIFQGPLEGLTNSLFMQYQYIYILYLYIIIFVINIDNLFPLSGRMDDLPHPHCSSAIGQTGCPLQASRS